jgi:hypothetical protein
MIIYGTRASHLKSVQLPNEICPNCNTKGSMVMSIYSKYAHIFWLPTFPVGRTGGSQCTNCQQVLEPKKMPTFLKLQYDQLMAQTRIPIWSFTGLAIIVALIAGGAYSSSVNKENEKKYVAAPMVGDIYHVETDSSVYSLMKVADVTPDSVMVYFNQYQVDKMAAVYQLKSKEYDSVGYWISRKSITDMYEKKEIFGVDR